MPTVHFTSQTIKGLTAGSSVRTDYFDTDVTGFGLRVTASGVKTWVYLYRIHGRPRRYTIGRYPDLSLADARDRAKAARNDVAHGADPSTTKVELRRAETFGELADLFIQDYAKPRKRTWEIDQGDIAHELRQWRHVKATEIKRRDVIALLKAIADRPAPIKANRIQSLIRKIYNFAIGRDLVETNPCTGIVPFGKEHRRTRVLSEDEIVQFWESAEAHWRAATGTSVGAILQLELLTAQRGQVRWMRWSDLDVANGWWTLPGEFAKNGTTSRVTLNRMAVRLLRELHALGVARHAAINEGRARKDWAPKPMSVWVFPRRRPGKAIVEGDDLPVRWTDNEFEQIRRASGAKHFTPHDLRRTAATRIPVDGPQEARRFIIKRILNHADREVTAIYDLYSYDAEKKRAIDAWGRYLERLLRRTSLRRVG
jgi:integrase